MAISAWLPLELAHLLKTNLGLPYCPSFVGSMRVSSTVSKVWEILLLCGESSNYFSLTFYTYSNIQEMPAVGSVLFFFQQWSHAHIYLENSL